jgi:hypothetical protein
MARLAKGDRVIDPDDVTATAVVVGGPDQIGSERFYLVRNQSADETYFGESDLARRDVAVDSPVAWVTQHALSDPDHLARLLTHLKLTSGLTDIIYSLSSTRTLFRVHPGWPREGRRPLPMLMAPVSFLVPSLRKPGAARRHG